MKDFLEIFFSYFLAFKKKGIYSSEYYGTENKFAICEFFFFFVVAKFRQFGEFVFVSHCVARLNLGPDKNPTTYRSKLFLEILRFDLI
jgi:hypothetical protein